MSSWKPISRILLISLVLLGIADTAHLIRPVHGAGILSIDPPSTTLAAPGDIVTVYVRVDNMDSLNGWDIAVKTNETALNGTSIDTSTDTVFPPGTFFTEPTKCINGTPTTTTSSCKAGIDGPGVVHDAAVVIGNNLPPTPVSGVLFSINYRAGNYTFSNISFTFYQITGPPCNPICSVIQVDASNDGVYGTLTSPSISFSLGQQSLSVVQGFNVNTTATITSINNFVGQVNLAYLRDPSAVGIQVKFNSTSVNLSENSTAGVEITITTSPLTSTTAFLLNITASGPRVFKDAVINLSVQPPGDFAIAFSPALLKVAQNSTTSAIVGISSQTRQNTSQEFSGNVTLTVTAQNATATLGQTLFYVGPGKTVETTITIWVPPSFYGFTYLINVTGVWVKNHNLNFTGQLVVTHLPSDLIPTIGPNTLTVQPGHSAFATFYVTSANYFVGYVYPTSTMSGGTARFNESSPFLGASQTIAISVNVTIDPSTGPGNYIVLLTATGQLASGVAFARSVAENIVVQSNGHLVVQLPTKILGLPIPVYFGILGGFAAIFVLLSALLYRKSRSDKDEWE